MRKYLQLSCKKAGELIEEKQSKGLPLLATLKLRLHLGICRACKQYQADSEQLSRWIEQDFLPDKHRAESPTEARLTAAEKAAIQDTLIQQWQNTEAAE